VDDLPLHFQRLIETHVFEREHHGVLTGAPLTDVEVQLLIGRAHLKHTEGGDFRQATYRAIRNALMHAKSILLEPIAGFEITVPSTIYGTAMGSLQAISAQLNTVETVGDVTRISGEAPYAQFRHWQDGFPAMTHGRGSLCVWTSRYAPCADAEAVIAEAAYEPLAHLEDTPESVFCSHGAGFNVAWDKVMDFAHCHWEEQT
jgi:translation elongation factor EF-G